jgi:predicted metal-binding membrane protein
VSSTPQPELPLARLLSRPVLISAAALVAAIALAWAWLVTHPMQMEAMPDMPDMPDMAMAPDAWSPAYLTATFAMWALMMVAMMLPSAAPMVLLHARLDRGSPAERARDNALFVLCYLAVWTAFSALAALWQLTAAKRACLDNCRSPIQFVMRFWRPGAAGAVRLGLRHGLYCLGCCWSLMLLLFVGGVMNLAWVALLASVVFAEKLAPARWRLERWLAALLAGAAGAAVLA